MTEILIILLYHNIIKHVNNELWIIRSNSMSAAGPERPAVSYLIKDVLDTMLIDHKVKSNKEGSSEDPLETKCLEVRIIFCFHLSSAVSVKQKISRIVEWIFFLIVVVFGYICYIFVLEFLIIPLYWYFVFGSVLYNCCRILLLRLMKLFLMLRVWNLISNFCVWYLVNTEIIAYCFLI